MEMNTLINALLNMAKGKLAGVKIRLIIDGEKIKLILSKEGKIMIIISLDKDKEYEILPIINKLINDEKKKK